MNPSLMVVLLFGSMLVVMALGVPITFALGSIAVIFTAALWGMKGLFMIPATAMGPMMNFVLVSLPLFFFMGIMLEHSGIAEELYECFHRWMAGVRGGLAIATIIICTIFAAMAGISGAAMITMGVVALPAMLKRGYDKKLAMGCLGAGGALGVLIPPSVPFVQLSLFSEVSVGRYFAGGVLPGLLLSVMFMIYTAVVCWFKPHLGPPLPLEERATWREKFVSLKFIILPALIIMAVLGSIFAGIATPTEAAAVGAFATIIVAAIHRQLTWQILKEVSFHTIKITSMVFWIMLSALAFVAVFSALGGPKLVVRVMLDLQVNRWVVMVLMQVIIFILGCFLDPGGIIFICSPVFFPIVNALGFDPLWFGVLFVVNLETSFLTPPFGFNLFYLRGVTDPKEITMVDIYSSMTPFVILQVIGLVVVMLVPSMATWLPKLWLG